MRVAIIDNSINKVEAVSVYDLLPTISGKTCIESDTANIGDGYDGENIIPQVAELPPVDYSFLAQVALDKSDVTVLRCVENSLAVPTTWATYRAELREIVASGTGPLPTQPAYPAGT